MVGEEMTTIAISLLVFPRVQHLDLTGPYEVFASWPATKVHLVSKSRAERERLARAARRGSEPPQAT
jgi:hypothetical protein